MFSDGWNPRNRSMPYANHPWDWTQSPVHDRAFPVGGEALVHQSDQPRMAMYETAKKVHPGMNQILGPTSPFPSSLNSSLGLQRSLLRGNPAASLLQPHVIPLAPRNYSLRQRPTPPPPPPPPLAQAPPPPWPIQSHRPQEPDQLDLQLLRPRLHTSNTGAALIMRQRLMALVREAETSSEVVREHPAPNYLTMPYLDQLDRPIQMVVDLVESEGEEAATSSLDLMLRL